MNKPINVLFTMANNSTAPYFEWFADLSLKSEDINLSFVMFTKERPELEKKYRDRGIQVHWIDFDCDQRKKQIFKAARKFRKLVRKVKPDIVHSHLFDDALICRIGLWMKSKPKFIVTKADTGFHYRYTPKWMILDKSINRKSAHLVAISGECKQFIIAEENTPADKISVIHHGIPKEVFAKDYDQEIREVKSLYPIEDKLLFCTVSRYIDWKGYLDIIDAIDKARHEYPQILHLGIGNGPQQEELQQEIDKRGLNDHFILTGWMNRKHVPAIFKLSKGFIHAAQLEPFGFVIAEAMAYKTPMISTKTGAAGDVLENMKSAYLFDYSDISESILKGIRHVLENDPTEMTENAFMAFQNNFSIQKMWTSHVELFKRITE